MLLAYEYKYRKWMETVGRTDSHRLGTGRIVLPRSAREAGSHGAARPYSAERKWAIIAVLFSLVFAAIGGGLAYSACSGWADKEADYVTGAGGCWLILMAVIVWLDVRKSRVIIDDDSVMSVGLFGRRTLFFSSIEGVELTKSGFRFVPFDGAGRTITFSKYYRDYDGVRLWAFRAFTDLKARKAEDDLAELASNPLYGADRADRLRHAERLSHRLRPLNVMGWVAGIALAVLDSWFRPLLVVCLLYPLIASCIYLLSKGRIKLYTRHSAPYPTLLGSTYGPAMGMSLCAVAMNILDHGNFWLPFATVFLLLLTIFMWHDFNWLSGKRFDTVCSLAAVAFFAMFYSYSSVLLFNEAWDSSRPQTYPTRIVRKWETHSKHTSRKLLLEPWRNGREETAAEVSRDVYNRLSAGDSVTVKEYSGRLGIPYYYVR